MDDGVEAPLTGLTHDVVYTGDVGVEGWDRTSAAEHFKLPLYQLSYLDDVGTGGRTRTCNKRFLKPPRLPNCATPAYCWRMVEGSNLRGPCRAGHRLATEHIATLSPFLIDASPTCVSWVADRHICATGDCQRMISGTMFVTSEGLAQSFVYSSGC